MKHLISFQDTNKFEDYNFLLFSETTYFISMETLRQLDSHQSQCGGGAFLSTHIHIDNLLLSILQSA